MSRQGLEIQSRLSWGFPLLAVVACGGGSEGSGSNSGSNTGATSAGGASTAGSTDTTAATTSAGEALSYARDVAPIFVDRCTDCHHQGVTVIPNIEDPFEPTNGLVAFPNTWLEKYPDTPPQNVAPGDPDNSFLMDKIQDPALEAGEQMPWNPPRLTSEEVATLRQWVTDGALNDAFFESNVRPIFGTAGSLGAPGGKCSYCHAPGGEEPNLSDPFDPEEGLVNVAAKLPNWTRVIPGDPDNSLLIVKVELTTTSLANGSPMPMAYERLSASEVETVRRWILEGAQDN